MLSIRQIEDDWSHGSEGNTRPKRRTLQGDEENCTRSVIIFVLLDYHMKEGEPDEQVFITHGRNKKLVQDFVGRNCREESAWKT
jgi:hypothetical protein